MASPRWLGTAQKTTDVQSVQITAYHALTTYKLTVNEKDITAIGSGSANAIAAALVAAWNASTEPEFEEITASQLTDTVILTCDTPGVPFVVSRSVSGGTGTMGSITTVTACTGPNFWDNAENWAGNVPTSADTPVIDGGASILYNIDPSIDLAGLTIGPNFPETSEIGLPDLNPAGYAEYRTTRLQLDGATNTTIQSRSRRIRLDFGGTASTINVFSTGTAQNDGEAPLDIIAGHASTVIRVNEGTVWVAGTVGDTATVGEIEVAGGTVRIGSGTTLTTLKQSGGTVDLQCAVTTVTKTDGELVRRGAGAITTLRNRGGTVQDYGTGTITTLHQGGEYDRAGLASLTITTGYLYVGSRTRDPSGTITWTNPVQLYETKLSGDPGGGDRVAYVDFGWHRKLTVADI